MIAVRHKGRIAVCVDSMWASGRDASRRVGRKFAVGEARGKKCVMTVGPSTGIEAVIWSDILRLVEAHGKEWPEAWTRLCLEKGDGFYSRLSSDDRNAPVIVVWNRSIYEVWGSGTIFECADRVSAIGCGADFAQGAALALLVTCPAMTARQVAEASVRVACKASTGCALPLHTWTDEGGPCRPK